MITAQSCSVLILLTNTQIGTEDWRAKGGSKWVSGKSQTFSGILKLIVPIFEGLRIISLSSYNFIVSDRQKQYSTRKLRLLMLKSYHQPLSRANSNSCTAIPARRTGECIHNCLSSLVQLSFPLLRRAVSMLCTKIPAFTSLQATHQAFSTASSDLYVALA